MKGLHQFFLTLLSVCLFVTISSAQDSTEAKKNVTDKMIKQTLLNTAKSDKSETVRKMCGIFYNMQSGAITETVETEVKTKQKQDQE